MDKEQKKVLDEVKEDEAQVEKLEGDIKSSFRTILLFVGVVLIALVVLAAFAFFSDSTYTTTEGIPSQYEYNNYPFAKNGNLWQMTVFKPTEAGLQQYDILVYYSPLELESIAIEPELYKSIYDSQVVVLALNDSSLNESGSSSLAAIGAIELGKVVGTKYDILNKQTFTAVIDPTESIEEGINIVDCSVVEQNKTAVVVFELAEETSVYQGDNGCIYVTGQTGEDIVRAADRFMYQVIGVMRE